MLLWMAAYFLPVHLLGVWCGSRRGAWKLLTFGGGLIAVLAGACVAAILASNLERIHLADTLGPFVGVAVCWFPFAFFMGWRR